MFGSKGQKHYHRQTIKEVDDKTIRTFRILQKIGKAPTNLKLPRTWHSIWPVFKRIFLTPYKTLHSNRKLPTPRPPPEIVEEEEDTK